jgi:hypothetical protein
VSSYPQALCVVKTKSTFEINNLKKRDVTMLHTIWLGEITIRHGQVSIISAWVSKSQQGHFSKYDCFFSTMHSRILKLKGTRMSTPSRVAYQGVPEGPRAITHENARNEEAVRSIAGSTVEKDWTLS